MFSFFTELNRKRPPARAARLRAQQHLPDRARGRRPLGDGDARGAAVPGEHRAQLHRPDAVPRRARARSAAATTRTARPSRPTRTTSASAWRRCDPRQRGLFGAAWTLGYIASFARTGSRVRRALARPPGRSGIMHRQADYATAVLRRRSAARGVPGVTTSCRGLTRAAGAKLVAATSSDDAKRAMPRLSRQGRRRCCGWPI